MAEFFQLGGLETQKAWKTSPRSKKSSKKRFLGEKTEIFVIFGSKTSKIEKKQYF